VRTAFLPRPAPPPPKKKTGCSVVDVCHTGGGERGNGSAQLLVHHQIGQNSTKLDEICQNHIKFLKIALRLLEAGQCYAKL